MKHTQVYIILIIIIFCTACKHNQKDKQIDSYTSANKDSVSQYGPTTMVRNVWQAKNGDILIAASWSGVLLYDGKSFTNLTGSKIGRHRFWDVLEDRHGNLWLTSTDAGVYCYNGKSFRHFTTKDGLGSNSAGRIYEDVAGNIWFGTNASFGVGGGASRYDGKSFRNFTIKDGLPNNDITNFLEDKTGKLWIGTRRDFCYYDGKSFTVLKNKAGETFYNVWGIAEDIKGNIWFGGSIIKDRKGSMLYLDAGLWRYDGTNVIKVSQKGASAIMVDKQGNIWTAGSINPPTAEVNALSRYDQDSLYNTAPTVTEVIKIKKMLCGILQANDGSIWIGSMDGVYRYDGKTTTDFKSIGNQK